MAQKQNVLILGAGVMGLTIGLQLMRDHGQLFQCTLVADKFCSQTTSEVAGAIYGPCTYNTALLMH